MASNTLFVSNFPFTTTEDELRGTFEAMGAVESVRIIVDRETGRSRGFAFVEFSDPQALDMAIEQLNDQLVGPQGMLTALPDTDPMAIATANSIPK